MVRPDITTLVSRETQTPDTAVYMKDMPRQGGLSAIDLSIRVKNGATSGINLDPLDVLNRVEVVFNGNDRRYSMNGQELFRLNWWEMGKPLKYTWDESASAVQEVWFRLKFGRFVGDPLYGIDLSRFNNVQLQIDYDMTNWGAVGATTFTTAQFTPTVMMHMFQPGSVPGFRGMIGARKIQSYTTVGNDAYKDFELPSDHPISMIGVFALKDGVAEAAYISEVIIGKDQFRTRWVDGKWYDLQHLTNHNLKVREEYAKLLLTNGAIRDFHLANIKKSAAFGVETGWATGATDGVINSCQANELTGNRATITGSTLTLDKSTATTQTTTGLAAKAAWVNVAGDIHGFLAFPFGDQMDLTDILQPADLRSAQVRLFDDASGAATSVIVKEIYS